jgi:hypothetical protein
MGSDTRIQYNGFYLTLWRRIYLYPAPCMGTAPRRPVGVTSLGTRAGLAIDPPGIPQLRDELGCGKALPTRTADDG